MAASSNSPPLAPCRRTEWIGNRFGHEGPRGCGTGMFFFAPLTWCCAVDFSRPRAFCSLGLLA